MSTYYTVPEAADIFGVCEETVRRRVRDKVWPSWRDGPLIRFGQEDIDAIWNIGRRTPPPKREDKRDRNKKIRDMRIFAP